MNIEENLNSESLLINIVVSAEPTKTERKEKDNKKSI